MGRRSKTTSLPNLRPMQIQSSLVAESRTSKILDGSLIVCAIGTLLALLLVLDAYEYVAVPGISRTNEQAPVVSSILTSQDEEKTDMQIELEKAQRYIEQKRAELEKLSIEEIEKVAESEGVDDSQLKTDEEALELEEDSSLQSTLESETIEDTILLEEKIEAEKEEVIEEIVEKEAGLDDWCPECIWLGTSEYSCKDRLWWIQRFYKAKEDPGKIALMKEGCSVKDGKVRAREKIDGSRLLRGW